MLFSPACERNKEPILAVLKEWLPAHAQVLEIGSGSGQHAAFFCQQIAGLAWQTSERQESLTDLQAQLEALSPTLPPAIALDVSIAQVHCPLKRWHGVLWGVACTTPMGERNWITGLHVWVCHEDKLNASSRLCPVFVFQQTLVQLSCWVSWKLFAEIDRARALEIGE